MTSHPTHFWRFIKSLSQNSTGVSVHESINGTATSALDKANALNMLIQSDFTKDDFCSLPTLNSSPTKSILPIKFSTEGMAKHLQELEPQYAPGRQYYTNHHMNMCRTGWVTHTAYILEVFRYRCTSVKLAENKYLFHLQKGNRLNPANYRPVSSTSFICKLIKLIIHTNITSHLEQYRVLNVEQHGVRRSQVDVPIMDFSLAFDPVSHQRIMHFCYFGITWKLHNWIQCFRTMRTQRVGLEGASSSSIIVTSGVPQGMVLGLLLFILCIDDLSEGESSQLRLLTDDCILCREIIAVINSHELQKHSF